MSSKKLLVGRVDKRERAMIRAALGRSRDPGIAPFRAPEPFSRADQFKFTEAYAIAQAERAAARLRIKRAVVTRGIPAQKAGDSMAGLQTPKKAV